MVQTTKAELISVIPELENILRWEDDGGMIVEIKSMKTDQGITQPLLIVNHNPPSTPHTLEEEKPK